MEEKLLNIAKEILEIEDITLDTEKAGCTEWDSAAHLVLLSEIEEEFGAEIPIEAVDSIKCLRDFLNFLEG
ncbi:MAG: acyl carrier protein [Lachnospiraceae bacterium]|nr:acyl carrier protein [Lachnospiraceae bacterium]